MRPPSPRRPGGKREQPSDAAGDEPDVGEATPASSQRARPGKGREERNPREGTQRSTREGFAQRRTRERGGEKSSREEARERRARARAERAAREQGEERHSRTTRGVLATPVASSPPRCRAARKRRTWGIGCASVRARGACCYCAVSRCPW